MSKYITAKGNSYTHFSREEREEIAIGLERGASIRGIAKKPGGSPSPVSREIRRNTPLFRLVSYRGNRAHQRAAAAMPEDGWQTRSSAFTGNPIWSMTAGHRRKSRADSPSAIRDCQPTVSLSINGYMRNAGILSNTCRKPTENAIKGSRERKTWSQRYRTASI